MPTITTPTYQTINLPPYVTVTVPGGVDEPTRTVETTWDGPRGRYTPVSVTVAHPMVPVAGGDLRHTPVRRIVADGAREPVLAANPQLSHQAYKVWAKGPGHRARAAAASQMTSPDAAHLERAATVFALEKAVGGFAVRAVERCLGLDYDSAKRWVAMMRRRGMVA